MLNRPPRFLLTALAHLKSRHEVEGSQIEEFFSTKERKAAAHESTGFARPNDEDCLYHADYNHVYRIGDRCISCDRSKLISRPPRDSLGLQESQVHFGLIASLNRHIKDGKERDQLAQDSGVCGVGTGVAGIISAFPCLVILGISDYADSHSNCNWEAHASAAAAVYAKELLLSISPDAIENAPTAREFELSSGENILNTRSWYRSYRKLSLSLLLIL